MYALAFGVSEILYDVMRKPAYRFSAADRKATGADDPTELEVASAYQWRVSKIIGENPPEWFQCRSIVKTAGDQEQARETLYQLVDDLRRAHRTGAFPMHPCSCRAFYGVCPYLDVCTGRASLDDDGLFRDRVGVGR